MNELLLRPLNDDDVEWIFQACQDAEIQRWTLVPRPYEREHAQAFVTNELGEFIRWAIIDSDSQSALGVISIHGVDSESGEADIGYWVAPWARGQGVGAQALRQMISGARDLPEIRHLVAKVASDNHGSQSVVLRAGFALLSHQMGPATEHLQVVPTNIYRLSLER